MMDLSTHLVPSTLIRLLIAVNIIFIPSSGSPRSCWSMGDDSLSKEELSRYSHIIEAQVIKLEFLDPKTNDNPTIGPVEQNVLVTVEVIRTWTPNVPRFVTFWTHALSVSGGVPFLTGRVYLIFIQEGWEAIENCGRTVKSGPSPELKAELTKFLGEPTKYRDIMGGYYE